MSTNGLTATIAGYPAIHAEVQWESDMYRAEGTIAHARLTVGARLAYSHVEALQPQIGQRLPVIVADPAHGLSLDVVLYLVRMERYGGQHSIEVELASEAYA